MIVRAIDQDAANALVAHLAKGDLLHRTVHRPEHRPAERPGQALQMADTLDAAPNCLHQRRGTDAKLADDLDASSRERLMSPLDPHVADLAPDGPALTGYDVEHAVTYMRMLGAAGV